MSVVASTLLEVTPAVRLDSWSGSCVIKLELTYVKKQEKAKWHQYKEFRHNNNNSWCIMQVNTAS